MAETVYRVITRYTVETGAAQAQVARLGQSLASMSARLRGRGGLGDSLNGATGLSSGLRGAASSASMLLSPIAALAGLAGIGGLVASTISFNDQLEQARESLGAILVGNDVFTRMPDALRLSDQLIREMRVDAEALPGSFEELLTIFRGSFNDALAAGVDPERFRQTAGQLLGVSHILGLTAQETGREFGAMLEGRATRSNVLFARLHSQIGLSAREYNALVPTERFERGYRALQHFGPALADYARTWDAIAPTARDHLREVGLAAGTPLFNLAKNLLGGFNVWFTAHGARLTEWAANFGGRLAEGLQRAVDLAERLASRIRSPAQALSLLREYGPMAFAARMGGGALAGGSLAGGVGGAAAGFVLGRVISSIASGAVNITPLLDALRNAARGAGEGLVWFNARLGPVIDGIAQFGGDTMTEVVRQMTSFGQALGGLVAAVDSAAARLAGGAQGMLHQLLAGHPELTSLYNRVATGAGRTAIGDSLTTFAASQLPGGSVIAPMLNAFMGAYRFGQIRDLQRQFRPMMDLNDTRVNGYAGPATTAAAAARVSVQHQPPPGTMHVTVRIEQQIHDAGDPDRVMVDTTRAIRQALQFPLESPTASTHHLR